MKIGGLIPYNVPVVVISTKRMRKNQRIRSVRIVDDKMKIMEVNHERVVLYTRCY